jgi:RNA polymerase sigma-70 factor (ECF subfamily)
MAEERLRFAEIHERHREGIVRYLHRMTRDPALAEDLAQETFLRVDRGLAAFRAESKLTTWLYRIATNVYLDLRRREASLSRQAEVGPIEASEAESAALPAPEAKLADRLFEDSEMGTCIREFVDSLRPEHRAVIILHDLEGVPQREIAYILDCSVENVKIRVHRARRQLKVLLSERCDFSYSDDNVLRCERKPPTGSGAS